MTAMSIKPWQGILTATATPFRDDLSIDFDRYADHVKWLASFGHLGVIPNGSLGEYQVLTREERMKMVTTAIEAAPKGFHVVPGVAAYGAREAREWAEHAAGAGASAVMLSGETAIGDDPVATVRTMDRIVSRAEESFDHEKWGDRKSTRLNSSHVALSRMPSSA